MSNTSPNTDNCSWFVVAAHHDRPDAAPTRHLRILRRQGQFAVEPVEDRHVRAVPVDGVQQPAHRGLSLLPEPEAEQRLEGVGSVADPGVAVVPVLAPRCSLPRRGSPAATLRCRRDRPTRAVQEQLEDQRAARHVVGPRPAWGGTGRTTAPTRRRCGPTRRRRRGVDRQRLVRRRGDPRPGGVSLGRW